MEYVERPNRKGIE
ncbi:hypothetical protein CGLO_14084 [Colletotrichum gloeosporioides Cg-14]|uniref:Uncharacterized protein n=1 Tax=Colletotrichum gloeosporioides (strain Cg-14) TaxID=1237896 RepID=T0JV16_COLGC|nr:hypothetical protein CGLO_14084 [Colletotrichum gloeosporioides Cg-14]